MHLVQHHHIIYVPSYLRTSSHLQTGRRQMGPSYLATCCPICRRDASIWDVPSADILSNLHTGQNVPRWAIPSTDGPICRRDKMLADGPSHLSTGPSADGTRRQMGRKIYKQIAGRLRNTKILQTAWGIAI